jgi:thiamine-phosphate pyrophosphorylase
MIPKLHYIAQGSSTKERLENIQKACTSGAELVQLPIRNISEKKFLKIALEAREITAHFQTRLIINESYKVAKEVKADGVHLETSRHCPTAARKYLYPWQIIGASANSLQGCETLIGKEVDYIQLGPFRSITKQDSLPPVLGFIGYSLITEALKTTTPIIAEGGIATKDVTDILKTGISGIASSREITKNFNNIKIFNQLLKASSTAEQRYTL